jgi:hypothetical protein
VKKISQKMQGFLLAVFMVVVMLGGSAYMYDDLSAFLLRLGKEGKLVITAVDTTMTVAGDVVATGTLTGSNLSTAILAARSDTNATTLLTAYTPRRVGDVLIGLFQTTNKIWIARGATTSDWQQVSNL